MISKLIIYLCIIGLFLTACAISPHNSGATTQLYKPQINDLNRVIREASNDLNNSLPQNSVIAFLDIYSTSKELSDYILDELVSNAIKDKNFTIADRNQIARIREEQEFQMSGEVADEQAVRIGRFSGAQYIVLGRVSPFGGKDMYRISIRALDVETATVISQFSINAHLPKKMDRDKNRVGTTVFMGGNYNWATLNSKDTLGTVYGYNAGIAYSFNFGESPIFFEPGLRYITRGYKIEEVRLTEVLNYLDVFLKAKADISLGSSVSFQPFVGVAPSYLITAQAKWDSHSSSFNNKKSFEKMNWLLPVGVDFLIMKSVLVGLEYDLGLGNVAKHNDNVITSSVMMNLGCKF